MNVDREKLKLLMQDWIDLNDFADEPAEDELKDFIDELFVEFHGKKYFGE